MNLVPGRRPARRTAVNHTRLPIATTVSTDPLAVHRPDITGPLQPLSNMDLRRRNHTAMVMATISNGSSTNRAVDTAAIRNNGADTAAAVTTKQHSSIWLFTLNQSLTSIFVNRMFKPGLKGSFKPNLKHLRYCMLCMFLLSTRSFHALTCFYNYCTLFTRS